MLEINLLPAAQEKISLKKWMYLALIVVLVSWVIYKRMHFSPPQHTPIAKNTVSPSSPLNLSTVALDKIKLVGFVQNAEITLGIVMLPNKRIYEIQVGTLLGKEKGRIAKIAEDFLEVDVSGKKIIIR